ncbi:Helicase conserved C-terminal domain containing protein [Brugia malayi]|uniref:Bm2234 n=1 Tax=Brugia malayi TaxID=6279 RepID=A0A0I9N9A2_BRUMA|nr:Helicase conserved C-terminal domain containing protein [Brugia malayi]CTP81715.1 Bm2234 [Brugia malayi]VIO92396.1 Helicase conserved C-terminal domain containing protein [Brugia malayi]
MATSLTTEQLKRIERNRAEALRRMALRQEREGKPENMKHINTVSNCSTTGDTSHTSVKAQMMLRPGLWSLNSSRKVSVTVRDESKPVQLSVTNEHDGSKLPAAVTSDHSAQPMTHRAEQQQPSTSAPFVPLKAKLNRKALPILSPIKRPPVVTTVHLKRTTVNVIFKLIDTKYFQVQFTPFSQSILSALKTIPSRIYIPKITAWSFPLEDICTVENVLQSLDDVSLEIEKFSDHVVKTLLTYRKSNVGLNEPNLEKHIEKTLVDAFFPYQRRGVIYGVMRRGRLLLADEMGLGKSIQALGIARYFKCDWPLLIICPSSVKFSWLNQFESFLPAVGEIIVIEKGSDRLPLKKTKQMVVIMSYDLMVSKQSHLIEYDFKAIIFDESHLLKDSNAQRTKVATNISKKALRVILLTGTPALSRPVELFSQIRIIDSKMFPNYRDFAIRYCDGKQGKYSFEAKGCTNSDELAIILTGTVMLRRLKNDVLNDLPMKKREVVNLTDDSIYTNISKLREAKAAYSGAKDNDTKHQRLVEYYYETGIAKAKSVARYIIDHYFYDGAPKKKVLIFAHHQVVLDMISIDVAKKGLRSIRIDGTTASRLRDEQCRLFQENDDVMVAVLSITAAGIGVTLTAASVVVFAELHWNPGTLKQAEDRAHRLGQKDSVFVQYLIAKGTADDILWPLIQKKLDVLHSCSLSSDTYRGTDSVQTTMGPESGGLEDHFPKIKRIRSTAEFNLFNISD